MSGSSRQFRRRLARMRAGLQREEGFTLLELMAALSILSIGFFALASASSVGLRSVAQARQRQAASEIANARLEHLRNIPYAEVALDLDDPSIVHSPDPNNPDYFLDAAGTAYDYLQNGTFEPLVLASEGSLPHLEDPVDVGTTQLLVYQYVTWVDDPQMAGSQDYKRLTVVAAYRTPVNTGRPRNVRVSAFFTPGGVFIDGTATSPTVGSTGSPSPSPTASPTGTCAGDTTAPSGSFSILSSTGATTGYTASGTVTLRLTPSDPCGPITARFSNDNATFSVATTYDPANPTVTWTLTGGDGSKSVWARFRDGVGNQVTVGPKTIVVDTTLPTVPGTLTRTLSCAGNDRTASLSWGSSSDTNLQGYRVYRRINGGDWEILKITSTTSTTDTHLKTLDSVAYRVVGYDKAGNESTPTNEIFLSKNQCS